MRVDAGVSLPVRCAGGNQKQYVPVPGRMARRMPMDSFVLIRSFPAVALWMP